MTRCLAAVILAVGAGVAQAQTWIHVSGTSIHNRSGFNERNVGGGVEWQIQPRWSAAVGVYHNSEYRTSTYALAKYHWWRRQDWAANLNLGAATGYQISPVVPVILPELCWRWTCGMIIPAFAESSASAVAFYLRIPY